MTTTTTTTSRRSHRRRTMGALLAGMTLSASLAAAGAFGLTGRASAATTLSGTTFVDVNNDGQITIDANPQFSDKRIAGVTVNVFNGGGLVGTTQSDASGNWLLVVNESGPFRVEFTALPQFVYPGYGNGGGDVQFTGGGVVNYGLYGKLDGLGNVKEITDGGDAVQIGNRVWLDTDADGIQDPGEVGINGVTVELLQGGATVDTAVTYADGNYYFSNLPKSTAYTIVIKDTPENHAILSAYSLTLQATRTGGGNDQNDSDAALNGTTAQIAAVSPPHGANLDFDFGYKPAPVVTTTTTPTTTIPVSTLPPTTIPPTTIPVTTIPATTTTVPATTTVPPTTVPPTTIPVTTIPATTTTVPATTTTVPATTIPPTTTTVPATTTTVPATTTTVPPTTVPPTTIPVTTTTIAKTYCLGDLLFDDLNRDGIRQSNEPGVPGQAVFAFNTSGAQVGTPATTDVNGNYKICGLVPGAYTVSFTKPANTSFTIQLSGNDRNNANSGGVAPAVTIVDADILTVDAGIVRPVPTYCLGDYVWLDTNGNGLQDSNEAGISGVQADLLNAAGATIASVVTDASGLYRFCGLLPGSYSVRFTQPSGLVFTTPIAGNDRSIDSDANSSGFTGTVVIVNADVLTVDAGLIRLVPVTVTTAAPTTTAPAPTTVPPTAPPTTTPLGCLGDKVFIDASGKGDADGKGIPGVTLTLVKPDGTTTTALTDANGIYTFCSLTGGSYTVKVNPQTLPTGSLQTYDLDKKLDHETTVVLPSGQSNRDLDFGYTIPIVKVKDNVIEQPAVDVPAFTGAQTTTQLLWGLSFLLMGFGIVGLATDRRRTNR